MEARELQLQIARDILTDRCPSLLSSNIETLAQQAVAKPIEPALDGRQLKAEIGKRITQIIQAQFPHLIPRREGRGGFITVGGAPPRGRKRATEDHQSEIAPESSRDLTDVKLSRYALNSTRSDHNFSYQRERERAAELVEEVFQQVSPANRAALEKIVETVEPGNSLAEIGRETSLYPTQVKRSLDEARKVLSGDASRRPNSGAATRPRTEGVEYDPPCVATELCMRTHDGATMPYIGADLRTNGNGHKSRQPSSPKDISKLTRPRHPQFVQHPQFGKGAILRHAEEPDRVYVEFEGPAGKHRCIVLREFLTFL